jgi:DNA-3-methyladenine glycosylase
MEKLPLSFYQSGPVVQLARHLLGKHLVTVVDGHRCSGRIVETEAYNGIGDRASHAFGHRLTARTQTMYQPGGVAYVYRCYGIHQMFNVVCGPPGQPLAVLIRALLPLQGMGTMQDRRGGAVARQALCRGPGCLAKAMGIGLRQNGMSLLGPQLYVADDGVAVQEADVCAGPRIGVAYAGPDAALPYRFFIKNEPCVSASRRCPLVGGEGRG